MKEKSGSHVFASSLMRSNTKPTNKFDMINCDLECP